jgi:hypothetical protein
MKISNIFFSFFSTRNFPHIPYVASNEFRANFFFRLSHGVAGFTVRSLVKICRSYRFEISATLRQLGWIDAPHTQNIEILKSLEQTQESKKKN